ncbi:MAG: hypothetical protein M0C28_03625 [Candidatus Moduliflexus flocculans]|nr:hypothetical protein [Candidatus Moduliflexus flocculans]
MIKPRRFSSRFIPVVVFAALFAAALVAEAATGPAGRRPAAARPGAGRQSLRPGQGRAGFGRGHRQGHDRAALRQPVGGLSARFADRCPRPMEYLGHVVGAAGRALDDRADLRLLPQARRDLAARPSPDDREDRGRPRHPARGDRRRSGAPRPRQAQGRDRPRWPIRARRHPRPPRRSSPRPGPSTTSTRGSIRPSSAVPRWSWRWPTAWRSPTSR